MDDHSICRICLSSQNLEPIFIKSDSTEKRCQELFLVTGLKIDPTDGLPQQICQTCSNIITSTLKLRSQCLESEKILLEKKNKKQQQTVERKQERKVAETNLNQSEEVEINEKRYEFNDTNEDSFDNDFSLNDKFENKSSDLKSVETKKVYKRKRLSKEEAQKYMSLAVIIGKAGPVKCKLCSAELKERRFFVNHAKTHFDAEHECEFCGKKFVNRNSMRYHQQRMHGAAKKHTCSMCPYSAVESSQLLNHQRSVHTGSRPYSCHVCGETFRLRAAVAQHMRRHFATYSVQCERCPALFRSSSELASHRNRVHLMTYVYSCYLCPGKYKAANTVRKHLFRVHGVPREQHMPIKCTKKRKEDV